MKRQHIKSEDEWEIKDVKPIIEPKVPRLEIDDYNVWLVVKPREVDSEDLTKVPFPNSADESSIVVESAKMVQNDVGHIDCQFRRSRAELFHLEMKDRLQYSDQLKYITPSARICGVLQVSRCVRIDGDFLLAEDESYV